MADIVPKLSSSGQPNTLTHCIGNLDEIRIILTRSQLLLLYCAKTRKCAPKNKSLTALQSVLIQCVVLCSANMNTNSILIRLMQIVGELVIGKSLCARLNSKSQS